MGSNARGWINSVPEERLVQNPGERTTDAPPARTTENRLSAICIYFCRQIALMAYRSLEACLLDLEANGQLIRIKEETDPCLEMAAIHLRVHEAGGPALLFENVKMFFLELLSNKI